MAATLTTAGTTFLGHLVAGTTDPTNTFDGLVFGTGNDVPAITDTQAEIDPIISTIFRQVELGYPIQSDTSDSRNPGALTDWWTWKFVIPAGTPFVASNVAVTNYAGGVLLSTTDLMVHSDQVIAQRHDERLIVFVNAIAGDVPTVYTATETSLENRVTRVVGFSARTRAMDSYPNGSSIDSTTVRTRPQPGQQVWTAAHLAGPDGRVLQPGDVERYYLTVERWIAADRKYVGLEEVELDCARHVYGTTQAGDQRWNGIGGYNTSHSWSQPDGTLEGTWRLTYRMSLCDGDVREFTNLVEIRRGGA